MTKVVACEDYKEPEFLRSPHVLELVLKCCSDINKGRWLKLLFYSPLLVNVTALFIEVVVLSVVVVMIWDFVVFLMCRKHFQKESKNGLITYGMILHLFGRYLLRFVNFMTAWTEICRNCSSAIVFWQHRFFAIVCLRVILLGSLNIHKFLSQEIF